MKAHQSPGPTSTAALLFNSRGEYLLHLRDANKPICDPGTWSLVGGAPEGEETPDEAIAREILEETGLRIPGLTHWIDVRAGRPHATEDRIRVYAGRWDGDADSLPVTEGIMFRWFSVPVMEHLTMCPWAYEAILTHQAAQPARGTGRVPHQPSAPPAPGGTSAVRNVIGAHLYLERDGRTLLGLRSPDVAFAADVWHALAGHVERESARACVVREAREEAGLILAEQDLTLVHTVHVLDSQDAVPRIQLFFRARRWQGEPQLLEPDKCLKWAWWPLDALPDPTVPYTRAAIEGIRLGHSYTELGWTGSRPLLAAEGGRHGG
ncbi:NUDIX hydrolase [Streptomyces xantholiticus]|uniref:NUDIX domain-containing protein n=1 Tax=Streptomyces xantholiticus TaxID=68285 RepID=A0ABV1V4N0_9ACTN